MIVYGIHYLSSLTNHEFSLATNNNANEYVYVIVWVAVVLGINCASNTGRKLVIVLGCASHYYSFLPALRV